MVMNISLPIYRLEVFSHFYSCYSDVIMTNGLCLLEFCDWAPHFIDPLCIPCVVMLQWVFSCTWCCGGQRQTVTASSIFFDLSLTGHWGTRPLLTHATDDVVSFLYLWSHSRMLLVFFLRHHLSVNLDQSSIYQHNLPKLLHLEFPKNFTIVCIRRCHCLQCPTIGQCPGGIPPLTRSPVVISQEQPQPREGRLLGF